MQKKLAAPGETSAMHQLDESTFRHLDDKCLDHVYLLQDVS